MSILGTSGYEIYIFLEKKKWLNYLQTVETLIRRRILRRLIWVCTVCQLPFYGSPDYNGLIFRTHTVRWFGGLIFRLLHVGGLSGSVGCAVRLETKRSRVQPPPRSATFFHGDWSWNIFYGHSLPSTDSRRAVVSFWRKNVHNTG